MISQFIQVLKSSVRPVYRWGSLIESIKHGREGAEPLVVVSEDTDRKEFSVRYRNVRYTACISMLCSFLSLLFLAFASNMNEFIFCFSGVVLFGLFYIRYSMLLWVSRKCWNNWEKRHNKISINGKSFFRVVASNPEELLPLPLSATGGERK